MRLTVRQLREIIREGLGGSHPNEAYEKDLADDPAMDKKSVYVPDDVKRPIRKWLSVMGLSRGRKKRSRSRRV